MYSVRADRFFKLGKPENVAAAMVKAVELLSKERLYASLLTLIVCYIDAIAEGDKKRYLKILIDHFPDLSAKLTPALFYEKYRNGMVHRMKPFSGYGLAEDKELKGAYFGTVYLPKSTTGTREKYLKAINMDRLSRDFLTLARSIAKKTKIVEGTG